MITLAPRKRFRKVMKRLGEAKEEGCPRGALLKLLIAEAGANVTALRPTEIEARRAEFIEAGKAYCEARCGGCELTRPRA
jgi:hypothetical protein